MSDSLPPDCGAIPLPDAPCAAMALLWRWERAKLMGDPAEAARVLDQLRELRDRRPTVSKRSEAAIIGES